MTAARTILDRSDIRFDDDVIEGQIVRSRRSRIAGALTSPFRRVRSWWDGLTPQERLMYRGLLLISTGLLMWRQVELALIVPGVIYTAVALGFSFSRPARSDDG